MVDMAKLKEDALQRKRQHEEKELRKQVSGSKRPARRSSASRGSKTRGNARNAAQPNTATPSKARKKKRSVSRWVLDILLFLGALMVVIFMFSPFG